MGYFSRPFCSVNLTVSFFLLFCFVLVLSLQHRIQFISVCVNLLGNAASTCSFLVFCVPRGEIDPCTSRLLCADASGTMQLPALPAIDDSTVDFGLFDSEINKEAADYDDGVEGDDHPG